MYLICDLEEMTDEFHFFSVYPRYIYSTKRRMETLFPRLCRLTLKGKFNMLIRQHGKQTADVYGVYGKLCDGVWILIKIDHVPILNVTK